MAELKQFIKVNKKRIVKRMNRNKFENISYEWLEAKKNSIKQSTYYNYKFIIEKYLNTYYGKINLRKIQDFSEFIDELSTYLSPKTIRDIVNILKCIVRYYEETYRKTLKYKRIILPKIEKKEVEILNSKEKTKLENYCMEYISLKNLGILICLNTGIRIGELCALNWKNIDLNEKCIYIRQTVQRLYKGKYEKSKIIIDTPKTKCSIREIPINTKLYTLLKSLSTKYNKEAFFLTGSQTKCLEPRSFQDYFKNTLKICKIKEHNFHSTRHTFATNCIEIRNGYKNTK